MRKLTALVLALCLVCSMTCAVAEGTQEIKVGKMSLSIPGNLVSEVVGETDGLAVHQYTCDDYHLIISFIDFEQMAKEMPSTEVESFEYLVDDCETTLYWNLKLLSGLDSKTAYYYASTAGGILFEEKEWRFFDLEEGAVLAHGSQGEGAFLMFAIKEGATLDPSELLPMGFGVACTLQMEKAIEK